MRVFDVALRVLGGVLAVLMGAGSAVLEALATPLFWAIPVGAALVGNAFLFWFARQAVGVWWAWLLPAVPWLLVMLVAMWPTSEGDRLADSYQGLGTFAAGAFAFFVAATAPARNVSS